MCDGVSAVICCHNGASRISETLRYIGDQDIASGLLCEVLVVDNASTDDTAKMANQAMSDFLGERFSPTSRVVREDKVGLANARVRGIMESSYDVVVFIDDDNWVEKNYLSLAHAIMVKNCSIGACGGWGAAVFESKKPDWFDRFEQSFAVGPQGVSAGEVSESRGYLYGAGLILRRHAMLCLFDGGFKFENVGRTGRKMGAGDDSEICSALMLAGWLLWYEPKLRFLHFMPDSRMSKKYLMDMHAGFGRSAPLLSAYSLTLKKGKLLSAIRRTWLGAVIYNGYKLVFRLILLPKSMVFDGYLPARINLRIRWAGFLALVSLRGRYKAKIEELDHASWRESCRPVSSGQKR